MRAVDTNVLVRLIITADRAQAAAAEQFARDGVWISVLVVAETIWVLKSGYGFTPSQLQDTIASMLDNPTLFLENAEAVEEALALFRSRPALGFSDCLILALARKAGHLPLGTFDRQLGKAPGARKL